MQPREETEFEEWIHVSLPDSVQNFLRLNCRCSHMNWFSRGKYLNTVSQLQERDPITRNRVAVNGRPVRPIASLN